MHRILTLALGLLASALVMGGETAEKELNIEFESEIYATRGDSHVTQGQIDAFMQRVPPRDRAGVVSSPDRIGRMVEEMLLQQRVADDADLDELLADPTLSAHIYQAATALIAEEQVRRVLEAAELDSYVDRARELYLANPDHFKSPETADFTHVLISTSDKSDREAIRIVDEIVAEMENGRAFDDIVREYSDDPSVTENGGSFGGMARDDLDKRFAEVLFELDPDEISDPVRTQYGWHIIRMDALNEGQPREFEAVRNQAVRQARQQHLDQVRSDYYAEMKKGEINIQEGATENLLERYPAPGAAGQ